jgi:triphosphoribosyl-dephospho-CoA synthetase
MPRRKGSASTATAIRQVRRQAGAVLAKLRKDIRAMETELARLKYDEVLWERLAGGGSAGGAVARAPRAASGGGGGGG